MIIWLEEAVVACLHVRSGERRKWFREALEALQGLSPEACLILLDAQSDPDRWIIAAGTIKERIESFSPGRGRTDAWKNKLKKRLRTVGATVRLCYRINNAVQRMAPQRLQDLKAHGAERVRVIEGSASFIKACLQGDVSKAKRMAAEMADGMRSLEAK